MASGPLRSPGRCAPRPRRSAEPAALAGARRAGWPDRRGRGGAGPGRLAAPPDGGGPQPVRQRVRTDKAVTSCGTTKTAANVPVRIEVPHGTVACGAAMNVERRYASAILAGRAPGNGGGGPVQVGGWTCEGFTTPVVLRTGNASKCVKGGTEILAILPAPA